MVLEIVTIIEMTIMKEIFYKKQDRQSEKEFTMSTIGIIGAMDQEVAILKQHMEMKEVIKKASLEFYKGTLMGKNVIIVRSGIGKVNASLCAQILMDTFQADYVIHTGVAGSLDPGIDIGDIVISEDTVQHDMDVTPLGYKKGQVPELDTWEFKADDYLINLAKDTCKKVNRDIKTFTGRIVSGDRFVSDKKTKEVLLHDFKGMCTEMEGAAIGQVAYLNRVPYVVIRAISDKADDSAKLDYPTFEKMAIEHTVKLLEGMLEIIE